MEAQHSASALLAQWPQPALLLDAAHRVCAVSDALRARWPLQHWAHTQLCELWPDPRLPLALREAKREDRIYTLHDVQLSRQPHTEQLASLQLVPVTGLAPAVLLLCLQTRDTHSAAPESTSREMARALAHEIRNPLGGLRGVAQLLQKKAPEFSSYTELLINECDRINTLVQRLLHDRPRQRERINVHDPIDRALALVQHEFGKQISIERDFDPSLPELLIDRDALMQALLNLLRNAVQAQSRWVGVRTRIAHRVELGAQLLKTAIQIDVSDHGQGVPEPLRERLFLPLVTGRSDGTGFGLANTLAVAEAHGGGLRYISDPGHTTFSLFLPLS